MKPNSGARYEIAIEAAEYLKRKNPNVAITVRDLESGEAVIIKSPPVEIRR